MEACTIPAGVNIAECIKDPEFLGRHLNPYVLLTDIKKSIAGGGAVRSLPKTPPKKNEGSEGITSPRISKDVSSSKKFSKLRKEIPLPDADSIEGGIKTRENGSLKRKRQSWDPSVEYEIEKIVGYHRDKRKKMWYLVKWKNWSEEHNTFEPITNLTKCNYELMKCFEVNTPTDEELLEKDLEIAEGLKNLKTYKRLVSKGYGAEDLKSFSKECPEVSEVFHTKNLDDLERKINQEYEYMVRCLIGMYCHQDPGLIARAQNYKILLKVIQLRREQLRQIATAENLINGKEETEIKIENDVDLDAFPSIEYIVEMKEGPGVVMPREPLLGCECPDGCSIKTKCCGKMADSVFAYKEKGRLRTSERVAIYECNSRCRCPPSCPNRVVQRGRQVKLSIFKTKSCGWGVKAMEKIPKGTFVCEYIGEIIPDSEAVVRDLIYKQEKRTGYLFDLDFFADANLDMYCIDATKEGNLARYINHSCDPNLAVYAVWVDGLEPNLHRLAFFASRNIQKGEEIRFDYENLSEVPEEERKVSHTGVRMMSEVRCQCNAANCREWVFGSK